MRTVAEAVVSLVLDLMVLGAGVAGVATSIPPDPTVAQPSVARLTTATEALDPDFVMAFTGPSH